MTKPVRLQLSRKKGFNLQAHSRQVNGLEVVNVARPTKYGNIFLVDAVGQRKVVTLYRTFLKRGFTKRGLERALGKKHQHIIVHDVTPMDMLHMTVLRLTILKSLPGLRGKNLACWCKPGDPCHADVLLELANP